MYSNSHKAPKYFQACHKMNKYKKYIYIYIYNQTDITKFSCIFEMGSNISDVAEWSSL
jgi:hypothetical protein